MCTQNLPHFSLRLSLVLPPLWEPSFSLLGCFPCLQFLPSLSLAFRLTNLSQEDWGKVYFFVFLHFRVLCVDELSQELPVKPRPPGISADFPRHGVLCLQKIVLAGLPTLLRSFSFQSSSHRISPPEKSLPKPKSVLRNSRLLAEIIFFQKREYHNKK